MNNKKKRTAAVAMATILSVTAIASPLPVIAQEDNPVSPAITQDENGQLETAPGISLPENLQAAEGTVLQEIVLPENWTWADDSTITTAETAEYPARFSVDDVTYDYTEAEGYNSENHYVERMVTVTVEPAEQETAEPAQENTRMLRGNMPATYNAGDIAINTANFPDDAFRTYITTEFDTDTDGKLSVAELAAATEINVANNSNIKDLKGIEHFTALTILNCSGTSIAGLDLSSNSSLSSLDCHDTPLAYLNIGTNPNLTNLIKPSSTDISILETTNKFKIQDKIHGIDKDKVTIKSGASNYDSSTGEVSGYTAGAPIVYEYNCGTSSAGKQTLTVTLTLTGVLEINETNFPDAEFRTWLKQQDYGQDGIITADEILMVAEIEIPGKTQITNLRGIENFTILQSLDCSGTGVTNLDVSSNSILRFLRCNNTGITSLDLSSNSSLTDLYCNNTKIRNLDLSSNSSLEYLYCHSNQQLQSLTVANALKYLECHKTEIKNLDVSSNLSLTDLNCSGTKITSLDLSSNSSLQYLYCHSNQQLQSLKVTGANTLKYLDCNDTKITSLDVSSNRSLAELDCSDTKITSLDVGSNSSLENLHCDSNQQLQSLKVAGADDLLYLYCYGTGITNLDLSSNSSLSSLDCHNSQQLQNLTVAGADNLLYLYCYGTGITNLDLSSNSALTSLDCSETEITSLDLSSNPALKYLDCHSTKITNLNVSSNSALESLDCHDTPLAYLNIGTNNSLFTLNKPAPANASIQVTTRTFKIQDKIIGIDKSKVSITSGASSYDSSTGVVSGYTKGTPIVYEYDCGESSAGKQTLTVTLSLIGLKENSSITITENLDKTYDGNAVSSAPAVIKEGTGILSYKWEKKMNDTDWEKIFSVPADAGTYRVTASITENDDYYADSDTKEFTIAQADPSYTVPQGLQAVYGQTLQEIALPAGFTWTDQTLSAGNVGTNTFAAIYTPDDSNYKTVTDISVPINVTKAANAPTIPLSLEGWIFGDTPSATVGFQYGQPRFLYADKADGTYTEAVPDAVGTWYVKAVVDDTDNYSGAESGPVSFVISPRDVTSGSRITVPEITADTSLDKLIIKDRDKVLVQGTDYDVSKTQDGRKVTVTITFKGNYTGTITKTYTVEDKAFSGDGKDNKDTGKKDGAAQTGDTASAGLWSALLAFSAGIAVFLKKRNKKEEYELRR